MKPPVTAADARREAMAMFDQWLAAEPPQRHDLLAQWQASAPALYRRLQSLIAADQAAEAADFLAHHAPPLPRDDGALNAQPGQRLGAWTLREPIGSGGMGHVWRVERSDGLFSGEAAIKLLHERGGRDLADTAALRARFAREGELLARLAHPNIARLLDAGLSTDGARYLVLEYVSGAPIDVWCDVRRLALPGRLQLLLQVCEAVSFAHAHMVVHRDLKPANILVSSTGQAKLLDFGVAKLLDDGPERDSELTRAAAAGLTPAYAAPEQLSGGTISTATDVYALGVLLFQLLCGQRPYAGSGSSPAQLMRDIVDTEPLSLAAVKPTAMAAEARGVTPAKLALLLRSDLAHIAARALQKQPTARYASVQAMADDVQRYLRHEPVSARAMSWRYQSARFVRRHRWGVGTAGLLALALSAGVSATLWQAGKAREQAALARAEAAKATAIKDFLLKSFNTAQIGDKVSGSGSATTVLQLIEKGGAELLVDGPMVVPVRLELLNALGELQRVNGLSAQAEPLQLRAQQLARQHFGATSQQYVYALVERAMTLPNLSRRDEANALLDEAIAIMEADAAQQRGQSYPFALWIRGVNAFGAEDYERALRGFERAAEACRLHRPNDATYSSALQWQANVHGRLDRFDAAHAALQQALVVAKTSERPQQSEGLLRMNLGDLRVRQGEFTAALVEYDRALLLMRQIDSGRRNPDLAVVLSKAARARVEVGQLEAARTDLREAADVAQHHPGGEPGRALGDWVNVGHLALELGQGAWAAARPRAQALAGRWPQDAKASNYGGVLLQRAEAELNGGEWNAARAAAERAVALFEASGRDSLVANQARLVLAEVLARQPGEHAAARAGFEQVLMPARSDAAAPPPRARQLQKARALAGLALLASDPKDAERLAREGLSLLGQPRYLRERQVLERLGEVVARASKP